MARSYIFDTYNAAYAQAMFERYLQNPAGVDEEWRRVFATGAADGGGLLGTPSYNGGAAVAAPSEAQLRAARAAGELVDAYRLHGHRAAHLDPLGSEPIGHPELDPEFHGITRPELESVPASMVGLDAFGSTIAAVVDWLRRTYTGSIGYEYEYLEAPECREWLRHRIEEGTHLEALSDTEKLRLLERLTEVEAFEQFLHRAYLGAKRFSIEGTEMLVPMLDVAIERAAGNGAHEVVIGMAHRGRLNVLGHVVGMPYADLIAKFEHKYARIAGTGDVKYHIGADGTYATRSGEPLSVFLSPNPSHLEFVNPVVEGMTRAKQTDRYRREPQRDENLVLPILIHGDAAFSAQGVVPETLNLAKLRGFRTGGTLHIIANNQIGFTTDPRDGRSTDYASDVARGFDIPIFHVNADDPVACLAVTRLAMMFREKFHSDVVIDLIGYRRYGHNEGDEPAYTQPTMYKRIAEHPSVRKVWGATLVREGVTGDQSVEDLWQAAHDRLMAEQDRVKASVAGATLPHEEFIRVDDEDDVVDTAVPAELLASIDRQLHTWPEDFHPNPKLVRQLEKRSRILAERGPFDWAHAEALAFGSMLAGGIPIRMTGQDSERGTFSQRHLVLHDAASDRTYTPLAHLEEAGVSFEIWNSPLSELAVVGFEYGYSVVSPKALVLWEAQFGDFVNGAQVMLDQFIVAGREKWGQESRLVLLLPHGYEGQGPEHSSGRLERFLQSAAECNMRIANCTTPAQYFHLLRRQALLERQRPLIAMTPKSLLRHPRAISQLEDLTDGRFQRILDDELDATAAAHVQRVILCSGKIFYELAAARESRGTEHVALVRVEQIYPLSRDGLRETLARYGTARELVWVQEEPLNMGAWRFMQPHLHAIAADGQTVRYIGRPGRASPAEGYATDHDTEQHRIVEEAMAEPAAPAPARRPAARRKSRQKTD